MAHPAGSVFAHCPRCAAEVEVQVQIDKVWLREAYESLVVDLIPNASVRHECFPAAVTDVKKGRKAWTSRQGAM